MWKNLTGRAWKCNGDVDTEGLLEALKSRRLMTERQLEVARLSLSGLSPAETAERLGLRVNTVYWFRKILFRQAKKMFSDDPVLTGIIGFTRIRPDFQDDWVDILTLAKTIGESKGVAYGLVKKGEEKGIKVKTMHGRTIKPHKFLFLFHEDIY